MVFLDPESPPICDVRHSEPLSVDVYVSSASRRGRWSFSGIEVVMKEVRDLTYDLSVLAPSLNVASASKPRSVRDLPWVGLSGKTSRPSSSSLAVTPDQDPLLFDGGHGESLAGNPFMDTFSEANVSPS